MGMHDFPAFLPGLIFLLDSGIKPNMVFCEVLHFPEFLVLILACSKASTGAPIVYLHG